MRIWLVQVGEELPVDPGPPRLWRTCLVAGELVRRGHEVTYWSSSFSHQKKVQRTSTNDRVQGPGYEIQYLYGRSYAGNISLPRILSQRDNARAFATLAPTMPEPDAILCGFPTIELSDQVSLYASERNIPFALDSRDMWPDIFGERLPRAAMPLASPLFKKWKRMRNQAYQRADAITGITDAFVDWGLGNAGRRKRPMDRSFHLSVAKLPSNYATEQASELYWNQILGEQSDDCLTLCFAGTMSSRLDLETLVEAVSRLPGHYLQNVQLVLCGDGDLRQLLAEKARHCDRIFLPGWLDGAQLQALMRRSDLGVLPYPNTSDFQASYPNKVGEFLGFGLPILTSLGGITKALLDRNNIGFAYEVQDVDGLTAALASLIDDMALPRSRKAAALDVFKSHFDPETIYPAFANWLEALAQVKEKLR
jgi:glycosyltransferase involved in cell wall biosynthesis